MGELPLSPRLTVAAKRNRCPQHGFFRVALLLDKNLTNEIRASGDNGKRQMQVVPWAVLGSNQ